MIKKALILLFLCVSVQFSGQTGFSLPPGKTKDKIPFRLVNNLAVLSVTLNDTPLSFILDTGVTSSILFSLENSDSLNLKNTSLVKLRGLGPKGSVSALKSSDNILQVGKAIDSTHSLYVIFDVDLNFSPRMGIPIHGILGNDFFRNFVITIDYSSQNIIINSSEKFASKKKCKRCEDFPIEFTDGKPYLKLNVFSSNTSQVVRLLIDSGSSDVLWFFEEEGFIRESPKNYFEDFLGLGLSGNIYGKRTQIDSLKLGGFILKKVNTAFPNEESVYNVGSFESRDGSIGGGFLSRFTVSFDYQNKLIRLKKNRKFLEPFNYNMSGLTIEHEGFELVMRKQQHLIDQSFVEGGFGVQLRLTPRYIVVDVRINSPAAKAGIEIGDEVVSVNGKLSYRFKLYELLGLFTKEEGKRISMQVKRADEIRKVTFYLKNPAY